MQKTRTLQDEYSSKDVFEKGKNGPSVQAEADPSDAPVDNAGVQVVSGKRKSRMEPLNSQGHIQRIPLDRAEPSALQHEHPSRPEGIRANSAAHVNRDRLRFSSLSCTALQLQPEALALDILYVRERMNDLCLKA